MVFLLKSFRASSTSQLISSLAHEASSPSKEARYQALSTPGHIASAKWRPWTLHPVALLSTLSFLLGIIGILEFLQRSSDRNHGLVFASDRDDISSAAAFLYLYFPTMIAVSFSIWWSWIDLDVKRLEPWYQLASNVSGKGPCPLLLEYPVEFLAWIPYKAAKRRHWSVVSASLTMVLVFWAVTPLQSGMFDVASTIISHNVSISPAAPLLPPSLQADLLGGNLLSAAYGVTWLGQTVPPFTTREFAVAPFSRQSPEPIGYNASMLAKTTLYRSELTCFSPASVKSFPGNGSDVLEVDDGQGCKQKTDITLTLGTRGENGFQSRVCDKYFIVWKKKGAKISDVSSLLTRLCQTGYYSQPVQANFSSPAGQVLHTTPLGPETPLPEQAFNSTRFEFVVEKGLGTASSDKNVTSLQEKVPRPFDISEDTVLSQDFRLSQRGFPTLNSIMAGIAVGGQNLTLDRFIQSPEAIDHAFGRAQQLLFALAISTVSARVNVSDASDTALYTYSVQSVQLVSAITRSVQAFLVMIAILIAILAAIYHNKFLPISSDPSSIGFLAALASRDRFMENFKLLDGRADLAPLLGNRQAHLGSSHGALSLSLGARDERCHGDEARISGALVEDTAETEPQVRSRNMWPTELRHPVGFASAMVLSLAIATLIFLDKWSTSHRGLPLHFKNTVAQQIILNYIPTVLGTLLEPYLIVVCRYLCFVQPFEDLRKGWAKASSTVLQSYTSLPPQLAFIEAIRNKHFRLTSLSFAAILANVLTVALSGVFVIRETPISTDVNALQVHLPILNQSAIQSTNTFGTVGVHVPGTNGEPFQALLSNVTFGTPLPPWTTSERYYLPVNFTSAQDESAKYEFTTSGFEGSLECTVLSESPSNFTYDFSLNSDATQIRFLTTQTFPNGTRVDCFAPMAMTDDTVTFADGNHPTTQIFVSGNPAGRTAVEMFMIPMAGRDIADRQHRHACRESFVGGWVRANITLSGKMSTVNGPAKTENLGLVTGPTANTTKVSLDKVFLSCEPRTRAAKYNITVDSSGQVFQAIELANSSFVMNETISDGIFAQARTAFGYPSDLLTWHHDTRAREWLSFFIAKIAQSDSLLDPMAPLPDGQELGRRASDVMRRLFALTLATNQVDFLRLPEPIKVPSQRVDITKRVFLSDVMYKIALGILCVNLMIILNIYLRLPRPFLPRMPTSIANTTAFFAASHFAQELAEEARQIGALAQRKSFAARKSETVDLASADLWEVMVEFILVSNENLWCSF